jgi:hypothetical protein
MAALPAHLLPASVDDARVAPATRAPDLEGLRRRIADVVVEAPTGRGFATGLAALDEALASHGGVPRGRLTEVVGPAGSGVTTLARRLVRGALAAGAWVAVVDATRTLAPRDWATPAGGLWVVRPEEPARAAWCADVLLRSGAFGLVVLDGAPVLSRAVALRLLQLARDADAALVLTGGGTRASDLGGALRLRLRAGDGPPRWRAPGVLAERRMAVTVEKGGIHRTLEVSCAVGVARRLCAHPEVPDRRPVAGAPGGGGPDGRPPGRGGAGGAAAGAGLGADGAAPGAALSPPVRRGRRAAEPSLGRR